MDRFSARVGEAGRGEDSGEKIRASGLVLGVERGNSLSGGELQWLKIADVYSADLSGFGFGPGDLVEWQGLSPM